MALSHTITVQLHVAASNLAQGVMANFPDTLEGDAEIQNATLRLHNLIIWELHRIFYHALVGALKNPDSWPVPEVTLDGTAVKRIGDALSGFLGTDSVKRILNLLVGQLEGANRSLPNPGA